MKKNIIKQKMLDGQPVLGVFQAFESPELTEMFGYCGFDFIVFDTEHGNLYPGACENLIRASECSDILPLVRIPSFERADILKTLDRGAMGILVPMVNTSADAQKIVSLAKYHPLGTRGLAFSTRAAGYGKTVSQKEHLETSNSETLVMVQVETRSAVENLDDILKVDGVDVIFIGPADLSQSLGLPGQTNHPEVQALIKDIIHRTVSAGKIAGIFVGNLDGAEKWINEGAKLIACGAPGVLGKAMTDFVNGFQEINKLK